MVIQATCFSRWSFDSNLICVALFCVVQATINLAAGANQRTVDSVENFNSSQQSNFLTDQTPLDVKEITDTHLRQKLGSRDASVSTANKFQIINAIPIVYSGQQAVGAPPGATHRGSFTSPNPALGGDSSVYYTNSVNGVGAANVSGEGLWSGNGTNTTNFWIINDPTPSPNTGFTFDTVASLIVPNDVGQTAFIARIEDILSNRFVSIWAGVPGALELVAREGDPAPGTNSTFTGNFQKLLYNNAGQVAFVDNFEGTRKEGIWSGAPGSIDAVALEGEPAPGLGAGATFFSFSPDNHPLAMNDNGELAFYSEIGGITGNPETIWVGTPDNLSAIAVKGQPAPGTNNQSFEDFNRTVDINN